MLFRSINAQSGAWRYTPRENFYGSDSFDVSITDDLGSITTQTITLRIDGVNDAPSIRITSTNSFTEDSNAASGDVVASFTTSDLDGDVVRVSLSDTTNYAIRGNTITLTAAGLILVNNGLDLPEFTLTPNDGISDGSTISIDPSVSASNDAPILTGAGNTLSYTENDAARTIDSSLSITDNDNTKIESAAIQIISGFVSSEDTLGFTDTEKITGSWDSKIGSLILSGSASLAQYENALESIIYANSSDNPSTTNRTISWSINDGESESTQITSTITVQKINDAPALSNLLISVDETISSTSVISDIIYMFFLIS